MVNFIGLGFYFKQKKLDILSRINLLKLTSKSLIREDFEVF